MHHGNVQSVFALTQYYKTIGVNVKGLFIRRTGVGSNSIFAQKDIQKIHQKIVVNIVIIRAFLRFRPRINVSL